MTDAELIDRYITSDTPPVDGRKSAMLSRSSFHTTVMVAASLVLSLFLTTSPALARSDHAVVAGGRHLSPPLVLHRRYRYRLLTQCGLPAGTLIDFRSTDWELLDRNLPAHVSSPFQRGYFVLLSRRHARFDYPGGHLFFVSLGRHTARLSPCS